MGVKKKHKKRSWLRMLILLVNWLVLIALLISYFSPVTPPETNVIPALLALLYPALLLANILFVVYWIIRWKYYFLFSLIAILIGYSAFFKTFSFNAEKSVDVYDDALKVLSYNVRIFDYYNWKGNQNFFIRNSVFDFVNHQQADVVSFQEFFHGSEKSFPTLGPFLQNSEAKNYHVDYVIQRGDSKHFGLATFTRFPIVGRGKIRFEGETANSGIFSDVVFEGDTLRVFNFHLESVKFSKADYQFVKELAEPNTITGSNTKIILSKLSRAFKSRAAQADVVARYIQESPYPVIVCGDFNDTPLSYVYNTVAEGLNDAFLESGAGTGASFAGGIPLLRIDYILHSKTLEAFHFERQTVDYSDHYPISAYFKIKESNKNK